MPDWAAIGAGLAGAEFVTGLLGAGEAKDAAKRQAELDRARAAEKTRQKRKEREQTLGEARTAIGASGVRSTGQSFASPERYLSELQETYDREIEWMQKWGASLYESQVSGAEARYGTDILRSATGAAGTFAKWWSLK